MLRACALPRAASSITRGIERSPSGVEPLGSRPSSTGTGREKANSARDDAENHAESRAENCAENRQPIDTTLASVCSAGVELVCKGAVPCRSRPPKSANRCRRFRIWKGRLRLAPGSLLGWTGAASGDRPSTALFSPVSYGLHVATIASNTIIPIHHCTLLHADWKPVTDRNQVERMATFGALRHFKEPLLDPRPLPCKPLPNLMNQRFLDVDRSRAQCSRGGPRPIVRHH